MKRTIRTLVAVAAALTATVVAEAPAQAYTAFGQWHSANSNISGCLYDVDAHASVGARIVAGGSCDYYDETVFSLPVVGSYHGYDVVEIVNSKNGHCLAGIKGLVGHSVNDETCGGLPTGWEYRWIAIPGYDTLGVPDFTLELLSSQIGGTPSGTCLDINTNYIAIGAACQPMARNQQWVLR